MDNINIFLSLPDSLYNRYLPFCCLITVTNLKDGGALFISDIGKRRGHFYLGKSVYLLIIQL